ncbi:hypothetical protein ABZ093_34025 [Streptomyces cyaneofuscatus]|uniref:hypothetical protein n=1 Tax=Streptomyces cyaneofuscatus TaxID=66883 RepID=UPI0033AABED3
MGNRDPFDGVPYDRVPLGRRTVERPDVTFRPVRNGIDYLLSAVQHLTARSHRALFPADRDGVLHLHAATEVLLKARLEVEHWSLVFADPGKATLANFQAGSFSSTTVDGAIARLRNIVQVEISDKNRQAIKRLGDTRNAFTHYGHSASALAVESLSAEVLAFLIEFIEEELHVPTDDFDEEFDTAMRRIRALLGNIDSLVADRMRDVDAELKDELLESTVMCPACRQFAVLLGSQPRCRFCLQTWTPRDLAFEYVVLVTGLDNGQVIPCEDCAQGEQGAGGERTLVFHVATADNRQDDGKALCFKCGTKYVRRERFVIYDDAHDAVAERAPTDRTHDESH